MVTRAHLRSGGQGIGIVAGLLFAAVGVTAQQAPQVPAAAREIVAFAAPEMQRLIAREGTELARAKLLEQNLSRYFCAYMLPTDGAESQRLVATTERINRAFAARLYRAAEAHARRAGAAEVGAEAMAAAVAELLPSEATPWSERRFFPRGPARDAVVVETIDLEALRDTGLGWNTLGHLAVQELGADPAAVPVAAAAVPALADAVVAQALLTFRLAGQEAAAAYAPFVTVPHLRLAEKAITTRAAQRVAAPAPAEAPEPGYFVDVTVPAGLTFRHTTAEWLSRFRRYGPPAPSFSGGGASAGDLDRDGWPDLVFCGGAGCAVFRNRGDGTFADHTTASGLAVPGEARMAVLADLDNDGDQDAFVTYVKDPSRLFENRGNGTFIDRTAGSGVERPGDMAAPAVAFDADGDGVLDLYVGNFGAYLDGASPWLAPDSQNAQPNRLFRGLGGWKYQEVTAAAGVGNTGWTQALSHVDYDGDGDQDLYLANDFGSNELYRNDGNGRFTAVGGATGSADPSHSMNVAFTDLNGDERPEIFVSNIWFWNPATRAVVETNTLLESRRSPAGEVVFERSSRLDLPGLDTGWSWAGMFFDADLDGDDDLYGVNGLTEYSTFVQYREHPTQPGAFYPINNGREPNYFLENVGAGTFRHASSASGATLAAESSRGLALLDFDRDGDLDFAVTTFHGPARLFRNDAPAAGRGWLHVELVGDPAARVNRDALGARAMIRGPGGLYQWRSVTGGEGYLGTHTPVMEFGLGAAPAVDLTVVWPDGRRDELRGVAANQVIRLRYGRPGFEVVPLPPRPTRPS